MKHLIIGNGAAGMAASKKLRELRPEDSILIISSEPYPPYSRCLLAEYLCGKFTKQQLLIYPKGFYEKRGFDLLLGKKVVGVDVNRNKVTLENGEHLKFDKLLIATGSSPLLPPIEGVDSKKVRTLRTISDVEEIIELASQSSKCAVIGGGYIGLEAAYALRHLGLKVTVLELMPHILYANFDQLAAQIIADDLKKEGIDIRAGKESKVTRIDENDEKLRLTLGSNNHLEVDFAVCAVGVKPNLDLVSETPISTDEGILVDEHLETTAKGIYAAGDVAQAKDLLTGQVKTTPIWPTAVAQGKLAAYNMADVERVYNGEVGLQNAMEFRKVPAIAFGLTKPEKEEGFQVRRVHRPANGVYKKLVFQGDVIKGMIFVGDITNAGIVTNLIKSKISLGKRKDTILDDIFSMAYLVEEKMPVTDLYRSNQPIR